MIECERIYVGGAWTTPSSAEVHEVGNPAIEKAVGRIVLGDQDDVDAAVAAARSALSSWAATSPAERADWLRAIHEQSAWQRDEIARLVATEVGAQKPIAGQRRDRSGANRTQETCGQARNTTHTRRSSRAPRTQ